MKKFLTLSVVAATIAWSMGISAVLPAVAATAPADGSIIKLASGNAVYMVSAGKKLNFTNRGTYSSWSNAIGDASNNFTGLKVVTQADFDMLGFGGNVTVRTGAVLVQFNDSAATYAVGTGAKLYQLADAAAKTALFPSATIVRLDGSARAAYYNMGNSVATLTATSNLPDGTFVKAAGSSDVYMLEGGQKRALSTDAATANFVKASWVQTTDVTKYATGAAITGKEGFSSISGGAAIVTPVGGAVNVALAASTPASQSVAKNGQAVVYTRIAATAGSADADITGFTIDRSGLGAYTDFDKIYVQVDGVTKGSKRTLTSDNTLDIYLSTDANKIVIKAGQTVNIDIVADMNSTATGNQNALAVSKVLSSGTVTGALPIKGNLMSISNISAPTVVPSYSGTSTTDINIGDKQIKLEEILINNTTTNEGVRVSKLTLKQRGTASNAEVVNYTLYDIDSKVLATANADASDNVVFNLATPITIDKSDDTTLTVKADVAGGKDETVQLVLDDVSYLVVTGISNGFRAVVSDPGTASSIHTIKGGDFNIAEATDTPVARSVAPKTNDVVLLKAKVSAEKEVLTVTSMTVAITRTGDIAANALKNVTLKLDGKVVAGPIDAATSTVFTEDFDVTGVQYLTVEADVEDSVAGTYTASIAASAATVVDSKDVAVSKTGTANGRTVTVSNGTVALVKSTAYGNENVVTGKEIKLGAYLLRGSDTQDVTVNKLSVDLNKVKSASSSFAFTDITGLKIVTEGVGTGSYSGTLSESAVNDINVSFTLTKNQTKMVDVYATIASITNASTTSFDYVSTTLNATYRAGTVSSSTGAQAGQTIALRTGTLTVAEDAAMADAGIVVGGTNGQDVAKFKFSAGYDEYTITDLTLTMTNSAVVTGVTVGGKTETSFVNGEAKFTGLSIVVGKDKSVTVPVTANFNTVGAAAASGATTTFSLTAYKANSATNNVDQPGLSSYVSNVQELRKTVPVVAVSAGNETAATNRLVSADNEMLKLMVSANSKADVILEGITLEISGTMTRTSTTVISLYDVNHVLVTSTNVIAGSGDVAWAFGAAKQQTIAAGATKTYYIVFTEVGSVTGQSLNTKLVNISWSDDSEDTGITGTYVSGIPSARFNASDTN